MQGLDQSEEPNDVTIELKRQLRVGFSRVPACTINVGKLKLWLSDTRIRTQ